MSRPSRFIIVTAAAIAALVLTPAVAMACRITNATPWNSTNTGGGETVYVWFDCGHSCGNYFKIAPGTSVAHRSKSGYVQACTYDGVENHTSDPAASVDTWNRESGTRIKVDASGEARVKTPGDDTKQFHWDVYDVDNNLARSVDHGSRHWETDPISTYCWDGSP